MRIIGGRLSGRRFGAPGGRGTRPTSDRVREALASALDSRAVFEGARVLDLFAGTGALSFEALSRGASSAVMIDRDPGVIRHIMASAKELGLTSAVRSVRLDLLHEPAVVVQRIPEAAGGFDLVFADAPYSEIGAVPRLLEELLVQDRLAAGAWVVVEHAATDPWVWPNGLASEAEYRYGQTRISLGSCALEKGESVSVAVYPGSFDPITKGHTGIIEGGLVAFEKIIVAVLNNEAKQPLFSVAERMEMIREAVVDMGADPKRVEVDSFDGLLVNYAARRNAQVILRGLRAVADFEYELQMANMNRHLNPGVETVFIMADDAYFYVASTLVKEVARLGGDVSELVPPPILRRLLAKFDK